MVQAAGCLSHSTHPNGFLAKSTPQAAQVLLAAACEFGSEPQIVLGRRFAPKLLLHCIAIVPGFL